MNTPMTNHQAASEALSHVPGSTPKSINRLADDLSECWTAQDAEAFYNELGPVSDYGKRARAEGHKARAYALRVESQSYADDERKAPYCAALDAYASRDEDAVDELEGNS